jgi:hypothetical protein
MQFDPERVLTNARNAATEDLLDRVTVYRSGMESVAVEIIEAELRRRGVFDEAIEAHAAERADQPLVIREDGIAAQCSYCTRPAVGQGWTWSWGWGRFLPMFRPRFHYYCAEHLPPEP